MVVRFVGVIRVPLCARVSRVCPVCVPAPPVVFLRYMLPGVFLPVHVCALGSQVKSIHKQQTTIRKPIELDLT